MANIRELRLQDRAEAAIRAHAVEGYPFEICGFLVGATAAEGRTVSDAWPVGNAWETDPEARAGMLTEAAAAAGRWEEHGAERRFLVSPRDTVSCMKRAREAGMDLVGVYHTHPNHPAVPSEFDRDAAWPDWSYIIVSVRNGAVAELRSWVLADDASGFEEEAVRRA